MTKKVAWTWAAAKVSSSVPVDGPGPSSKVRATHWSFAQLTVPPVGGCVGGEVVGGVVMCIRDRRRISTLGDRVDPVTVGLAGGREASMWVLDKAGVLALSGPVKGEFFTIRLGDFVDSLPLVYAGQGNSANSQVSWFAAYLLPAGATDATVTYLRCV